MNYYIEKHDMNIILDALECLHQDMKHADESGYADINKRRGYTMDEVDALFQSFDNSGADDAIERLKPMEDGKFGFYTGK